MSKDRPFPEIPEILLTELAKRFPDRLPDDPDNSTAIAVLIGQQKVIRFLRAEFARQNTTKD